MTEETLKKATQLSREIRGIRDTLPIYKEELSQLRHLAETAGCVAEFDHFMGCYIAGMEKREKELLSQFEQL